MTQVQGKRNSRPASVRFSHSGARGFTIVELLIVVLVGTILTAISVPVIRSAMTDAKISSTVSAISGALSQTRYAAIMNSNVYTLVVTAPANTYTVTNVTTGVANTAVPLPSTVVAINGGAGATYTFTMCPNGTVSGAGGVCPPTTNPVPPALSATYNGRQVNINVSTVGNVTTTNVE